MVTGVKERIVRQVSLIAEPPAAPPPAPASVPKPKKEKRVSRQKEAVRTAHAKPEPKAETEIPPAPEMADMLACWDCGYEFTVYDTGEKSQPYDYRHPDRSDRLPKCEPHAVEFLNVVICDHCFKQVAKSVNKFQARPDYAHPSIKALDAAHAKRMREMGEKIGGFYNPKTYSHPSVAVYYKQVQSGKIDLGLKASVNLLPDAARGIKSKDLIRTATIKTMDENEAVAFKVEMADRKARKEAREKAEEESASAAWKAAMRPDNAC